MTYAQLFIALLQSSGTLVPAIERIVQSIKAGKSNDVVTDADWAELTRLAGLTSDDIYKREGITPPPPTP
jgi:hypothetical protein